MDKTKRVYGIDLGTTNSCIAFVDDRGEVVFIPGDDNRLVVPSVVYFESPDNVIVGDAAREYALVDGDQSVQLVKIHMGEPYLPERIFGRTYRPQEISAYILKKLARCAESHTGMPVKDVVITVPAYFDSEQRTATREAGEIAGLNVLALIPEPTAAAIAYSALVDSEQTILVYDLGGGTFDVTVMSISGGRIAGVCTKGDYDLGGNLWDKAVIEYFAAQWQAKTDSEEYPLDDLETLLKFGSQAEKAKHALTNLQTARALLHHRGLPAQVELTREKFDQLTSHLLNRTLDMTRRVVALASDKGYGNISRIIMVGGSSRMPQVEKALKAEFGLPIDLFQPDLAVAKGAAMFAANKQTQEQGELSVEVLTDEEISRLTPEEIKARIGAFAVGKPLERQEEASRSTNGQRERYQIPDEVVNISSKSFGVIAYNREMTELKIFYQIKKDTPVSKAEEQQFQLVEDGQQVVNFQIIESTEDNPPDPQSLRKQPHDGTDVGPEELPLGAKKIGELRLKMPPGLRRGSPIMVLHSLSEDGGSLHVIAKELTRGKAVRTEVSQVNALTRREIEEIRATFPAVI